MKTIFRIDPAARKLDRFRYRIRCPRCGNQKRKCYVDVALDVYYCFHCEAGRRDRFSALCRRLGIDPPGRRHVDHLADLVIGRQRTERRCSWPEGTVSFDAAPSWMRRAAEAYFVRRRVPLRAALAFGVRLAEEGRYAGRMILPIFDESGRLVWFQTRTLSDVEPKKYMNAPGPKPDLAIFGRPWARRLSGPLVVTEGIAGAMRLLWLGRPAVSVLGSVVDGRDVTAYMIAHGFSRAIVMYDRGKEREGRRMAATIPFPAAVVTPWDDLADPTDDELLSVVDEAAAVEESDVVSLWRRLHEGAGRAAGDVRS